MLKTLIKISKQPLLLPFYHLVSDAPPLFVKNLYKPKTVKQFKEDLDFFLENYTPITLEEVIQYNKGEITLTKPSFHLTFDDGLANFYHTIAPILIKKKIPATVFLNTDFVDNKELFYRYKASLLIDNYLNCDTEKKQVYADFITDKTTVLSNTKKSIKHFLLSISFQKKHFLDELADKLNYSFSDFLAKEKPYLSLIQIKDLQKKGFTFGAHSLNHPLYADLSLAEQVKQTQESVNWIKNNLDEKHLVFSFPFHDIGISKSFFDKIKTNLTLSFGTSGIKKDEIPFHLHRLDMETSNTTTILFLLKNYLKFFLKIPFGKNKINRK